MKLNSMKLSLETKWNFESVCSTCEFNKRESSLINSAKYVGLPFLVSKEMKSWFFEYKHQFYADIGSQSQSCGQGVNVLFPILHRLKDLWLRLAWWTNQQTSFMAQPIFLVQNISFNYTIHYTKTSEHIFAWRSLLVCAVFYAHTQSQRHYRGPWITNKQCGVKQCWCVAKKD